MDDEHDTIRERVAARVNEMSSRDRSYFVLWLTDYDPEGLDRMLAKFAQHLQRPATNSGP